MPHVRVAHRMAPVVVPVRPVLPKQRMVSRLPANPRPSANPHPSANPRPPANPRPHLAPRRLPVLQPPMFFRQSDFIYEEEGNEQQQQEEFYDYSAIADSDQRTKITQQISVRVPTFIPQQNYPRQPLPHLSTRPIRHAERKYSTHFYLSQ